MDSYNLLHSLLLFLAKWRLPKTFVAELYEYIQTTVDEAVANKTWDLQTALSVAKSDAEYHRQNAEAYRHDFATLNEQYRSVHKRLDDFELQKFLSTLTQDQVDNYQRLYADFENNGTGGSALIHVIKQVRQDSGLGLGLKVTKDLVESWRDNDWKLQ